MTVVTRLEVFYIDSVLFLLASFYLSCFTTV